MNYSIEHRDKIVIFTVKHTNVEQEISSEFKGELLIVSQPDIQGLIIDMTMVEMMDSSGIGALLLAKRQLKEHGVSIVIVTIEGIIKTLLEISKLDQLFVFTDTVEEAIAYLQGDEEAA